MNNIFKIMTLIFALSIPSIALSQTTYVPPWVQDEIDAPTSPEKLEGIRKKRAVNERKSSYVFTPRTNAIRMGGLSIEMTLNQMERTLTAKGYECLTPTSIEEQAAYLDIKLGELSFGIKTKFCHKGNEYVRLSDDRIFIPCEYFGVCGQGLREVAQTLVDQDKVEQLTYDLDRKGQTIISKYCGSGAEGDRICVVDETYENRSSIYFELMKGSYGRGGRSFD